jgi:hypothetical protein
MERASMINSMSTQVMFEMLLGPVTAVVGPYFGIVC